MQTYDDLEILALAWMAMMFAVLIVVLLLTPLFLPRQHKRPMATPQRRAVCDHKRWYRTTTSRINDYRPNGGTRGEF